VQVCLARRAILGVYHNLYEVPMPSRLVNAIEYVAGSYMLTDTDESGQYRARDDIEPHSPMWYSWLSDLKSFRFQSEYGHFTARHEKRHGSHGY
jgi:hypothetical protein